MKLITIFWRDIPAQVLVKKGRSKAKRQLPQRFQVAIDRAAMRAGKGGSDAYMNEWRRENLEVTGDDLEMLAADRARELEAAYNESDLELLIKNKGFAEPIET
jgi:hypothetical protein